MNSNKKKSLQLGMAHGTAANRLRKMILFSLLRQLELDTCFQCGREIESIENLSVEHKVPWLDSADPISLFFDLDNIAFSHLSCNVGAARQTKPRTAKCGDKGATRYYSGCRCEKCKEAHATRLQKWRKSKRQ